MKPPEFTSPGGPLRQSLLRTFEACALSAMFQARGEPPNVAMDVGTVVHAIFAEMLRTMRRTGETQIPHQEAVEIAREVYARHPIVLPAPERRDMIRFLILPFCAQRWPVGRIISIEERLFAEIVCPDGQTRILTGQPDVLVADLPDGVIVPDHKTGKTKPPRPKKDTPEEWQRDGGRPFLSAQGVYQLDIYGVLVLHNLPTVKRVRLKEHHWRWGETRNAVMTREDLEHVEPLIGAHLMKLDNALSEGDDSKLWRARPGSWCHYCSRPDLCTIPKEQRREGSIDGPDAMHERAEQWVTADALKASADVAVKAALAAGLAPAVVGDKELRWSHDGPGRRFGLHPREEAK